MSSILIWKSADTFTLISRIPSVFKDTKRITMEIGWHPSQIGKSHVWFSPRLCFLVFIVHHPFSIILFCSFLVGWMASTWCLVTWSRDWIFLNASRYVAHYQGRREICPPVLETPLLWFPPQSPSLLYLLVFIFSSSFEQAVGTDSGKPSKKVVITDCGQL